MVKPHVVSRYKGNGPPANRRNLQIDSGPLYAKQDFLSILDQNEQSAFPWTDKCIKDVQKLSLDHSDLGHLIRDTLTAGRYRNSFWCKQTPNGPWAAADDYVLRRYEQFSTSRVEVEYYLKLAIAVSDQAILVVSCHPPEQK